MAFNLDLCTWIFLVKSHLRYYPIIFSVVRTVFTLKLCYFLFLSLVAKYFARHLADSVTGTSARYSSFARHTMIPATGEGRCVTKQNEWIKSLFYLECRMISESLNLHFSCQQNVLKTQCNCSCANRQCLRHCVILYARAGFPSRVWLSHPCLLYTSPSPRD